MQQHQFTKAIFPGSFDPFTIGHESLVLRSLSLFDEIVIAIGINNDKHAYFTTEQRLDLIKTVFEGYSNIEVVAYDGLTIDFAKKIGATHILRGLRNVADFEFEQAIAHTNKQISGIDTFFLLTMPEHSSISSSIVRDILRFKGDVSMFIPQRIRHIVK